MYSFEWQSFNALSRSQKLKKLSLFLKNLLKKEHPVYGVGKYKPCKEGIKDINNVDNNYELTENSKPTERILFNTGRLKQNPDLKEDPQQYENSKGLNYNEFVVYDNAQVKLRYAVLCEFEFQWFELKIQ